MIEYGEYGDGDEEPAEGWQVRTLEDAAWAMERLAQAKSGKAKIDAFANRKIQKYEEWRLAANAPAERSIKYFEGALTAWAILNRTSRGKSFILPGGTVTTREVAASVDVDDEAAALTYARAHQPGLVIVKEAVARKGWTLTGGAVRDPDTGEEVPGLSIRPGRVSVTVKPAAAEESAP